MDQSTLEKILRGLDLSSFDSNLSEEIFDQNKDTAVCPACGASFSTKESECPECGLVFIIWILVFCFCYFKFRIYPYPNNLNIRVKGS